MALAAPVTGALALGGAGDAIAGPQPSNSELKAMRAAARTYMDRYGMPALSVCIARRGEVVFSEAFGVADKSSGEPARPDHLFRIASLSKPITSIAVFSLVEAGRVKLSDRVFGPGGLLAERYSVRPDDKDLQAITLDHLLTHTSGGWPNDGRDPMFRFGNQTPVDLLISETLATQLLDNTPGKAYAYSNFGYCLVGRIIETVTGQSYADFVRDTVLVPSGAVGLQLAGNRLEDRLPTEVRYDGQDGDDPYSMNVNRMDSHGGWVASAPDLVNILLHVDRFKSVKDMLKPATIKTMVTPTKASPGYARGWSVNRYDNWWHTGALPGSTTIMVRTGHGFCWAALTNSRRRNSDADLALDNLIWEMVERPKSWRV